METLPLSDLKLIRKRNKIFLNVYFMFGNWLMVIGRKEYCSFLVLIMTLMSQERPHLLHVT